MLANIYMIKLHLLCSKVNTSLYDETLVTFFSRNVKIFGLVCFSLHP